MEKNLSTYWNLFCHRKKSSPLLSKTISLVAVILYSAASSERDYNEMNLIKNKLRSLLHSDSLKVLPVVKLRGPPVELLQSQHMANYDSIQYKGSQVPCVKRSGYAGSRNKGDEFYSRRNGGGREGDGWIWVLTSRSWKHSSAFVCVRAWVHVRTLSETNSKTDKILKLRFRVYSW